jgi:hypothetical protein
MATHSHGTAQKRPSKNQLKLLKLLAAGWKISTVPRSICLILPSGLPQSLSELHFKGLQKSGWLEDDDVPYQLRISRKGREAIGKTDPPLCH